MTLTVLYIAGAAAICGVALAAPFPSSGPGANLGRQVGILYEVWHTEASNAMAQVKAQGGKQLTVETVIHSNGNLTLDDVYGPYNVTNHDIWNVQPAELGFYCLYRARSNDTNPPVPDCQNTSGVAERHAKLLLDAGFDYIAVDITNWPQMNIATDIAVIRPLEVLLEEWTNLRARGILTPKITVWPASPVASYPNGLETTWHWLLREVYNNATYEDLLWKRPNNGNKKVMFVTDNSMYNASVAALIANNDGRNDIEVLKMWALFGEANYASGSWGFFSPCRQQGTVGYTTSMVGDSTVLGPCDQFVSNSPNGSLPVSEVSASGGYMLSQCSLPFASPGHMRGLTLQRLFKKVHETGAPNLFMSSFNEFIGGRQSPAYKADIAFNMGLPEDPQSKVVWVDTYAAEFSRDIEPTVEAGDRIYQVAASCISIYKKGQTCDTPGNEDTPCCSTEDKFIWNNVWSLKKVDGTDRLLTIESGERATLIKEGWEEVCHVIVGPSVFCVDSSTTDGRDGPFMIFSVENATEGTLPLYRCTRKTSGEHFFSTHVDCEGETNESVIGYLSPTRGFGTLRALRRCKTVGGVYSHSLDLTCPTGTTQDGDIMGFVR